MALHFPREEFDARKALVLEEMAERKLDALLLFAQESMYWLTGYDTFGFWFFQCLILTTDGRYVLVTRLPDLRQARHTSIVEDIRIWTDRADADLMKPMKETLYELDLLGKTIGVETDTHGLTAWNGLKLEAGLRTFATVEDASDIVPALRAVKAPAEIAHVRKAAELAENAWAAGLAEIRPGADEGRILAAMQGAVLEAGGDYPANPFVVGSGRDALLCRYKSGRRRLDERDQVTLQFAGVWRHYHVVAMETVVVGEPTARHRELFGVAREALAAVREVLRPGFTFGEVFDAHARVIDGRGLHDHRLAACGHSLGARFAPSWIDPPLFYRGNQTPIEANMVLFPAVVLFDSESGTAVTRGRTFLVTDNEPEPLADVADDMVVV